MIARRRARGIRAFRIVDRLVTANAQSLSIGGPLLEECANPPIAALRDAAGIIDLA